MSMPTYNELASQSTAADQATLRWTIHLARQRPRKLIGTVACLLLACAAAYSVIGPLGSVAVAAMMAGALAEFWFPVTYEITSEGATCRMLHKSAQIKWIAVRRCYLDSGGVKLSPLNSGSKLEAFRGVYLRFNGNDEQVIEAVKARRPEPC